MELRLTNTLPGAESVVFSGKEQLLKGKIRTSPTLHPYTDIDIAISSVYVRVVEPSVIIGHPLISPGAK